MKEPEARESELRNWKSLGTWVRETLKYSIFRLQNALDGLKSEMKDVMSKALMLQVHKEVRRPI
jgi:hypothetical protein